MRFTQFLTTNRLRNSIIAATVFSFTLLSSIGAASRSVPEPEQLAFPGVPFSVSGTPAEELLSASSDTLAVDAASGRATLAPLYRRFEGLNPAAKVMLLAVQPDSRSFFRVPEPATFVLFFMTLSGVLSYTLWQYKNHRATQPSRAAVRSSETRAQTERLAAIGQLLGEVMHDVKNALTGIRTCAEILGYDNLAQNDRQEFVQRIVSQVDQVVEMAQDLLEFSYEPHGALHLQTLSMQDFMQDMLSAIEHDFALHRISLRLNLQYTGTLHVDVKHMKRAFLNIASNARDAMPDGGVFTIISGLKGEQIEFALTDTGCGMSPELQAHFLEPFVTAGKRHGTGLGMAIVKGILDAHQAQFDVRSVIAEGTTILISLPR